MRVPKAQSFNDTPGNELREPESGEISDVFGLQKAHSFTAASCDGLQAANQQLDKQIAAADNVPAVQLITTPTSRKGSGSPQVLPAVREADMLQPMKTGENSMFFEGRSEVAPSPDDEDMEVDMQVPLEPAWPHSPSPWVHTSEPSSTSVSPAIPSVPSNSRLQEDAIQSDSGDTVTVPVQYKPDDDAPQDMGCRSCLASPRFPATVAKATVVKRSPVTMRCTPKKPFWSQQDADMQPLPSGSRGSGGQVLSMTGVPLGCLSDVVDSTDREQEIEVRENDLTTVHISSWEQRLDWRSFLSEAVASSLARQAFKNFDVEAEPPAYARPPPSSARESARESEPQPPPPSRFDQPFFAETRESTRSGDAL